VTRAPAALLTSISSRLANWLGTAVRVGGRASHRFSRKSIPIWVEAPAYSSLSGGMRAMNLLCYHLNRLGYDAFISGPPQPGDAPVPLRYLTESIVEEQRRQRREPVVVYPEVIVGNPRQGPFVVRYLLNRPGFLVPGAEQSFGKDDYFIDFAREHAPAGVRSFDLFMPLVNHSIYFPPQPGSPRDGFVVFSHRAEVDPASRTVHAGDDEKSALARRARTALPKKPRHGHL
jgi:hypothetical protein